MPIGDLVIKKGISNSISRKTSRKTGHAGSIYNFFNFIVAINSKKALKEELSRAFRWQREKDSNYQEGVKCGKCSSKKASVIKDFFNFV